MRMGPVRASQIRSAKLHAIGGSRKRCKQGKNCSATCIDRGKWCLVDLPTPASTATTKVRDFLKSRTIMRSNAGDVNGKAVAQGVAEKGRGEKPADYSKWSPVAEGNYGKVSISPDGTRAVKELLVGKDGKKGEFGPHEVELARKMGDLGHSPKIYKATDKALEMDVARGKPLWSGYARGENEPVMNAAQATKAAAAIKDLHKMGFAHGDMHALQFLVDGNNVKLVDYGLSKPISAQPVKVMQDLSKIAKLVDWQNPELAGNPYVQLVNRYLPAYREIKGTSKKAVAEKEAIAQNYLRDLQELQ